MVRQHRVTTAVEAEESHERTLVPRVPILVFIAVWFFIMRRGGWAKHYENHMQRCEKHHRPGTVVRRARQLGVAILAFDALYAILKVRARTFGGID